MSIYAITYNSDTKNDVKSPKTSKEPVKYVTNNKPLIIPSICKNMLMIDKSIKTGII